MSRSRRTFVMLAALSLGAACSNDPAGSAPGPRAGTLTVRLTTPHGDDGAMTFELRGPAIDTAMVVDPSLRLFTRRESDSRVVGAVVGPLANGAVIRLQVPDVSAAGYTANVLEVADRQDVLRFSLEGYALTVAP